MAAKSVWIESERISDDAPTDEDRAEVEALRALDEHCTYCGGRGYLEDIHGGYRQCPICACGIGRDER